MMSICIQWINCVQLSSNMKALTRNVKFKTPSCFCKSNAHKQWKELLNSTSVTTLIFFLNSILNIIRQFMAFANFVSTNGYSFSKILIWRVFGCNKKPAISSNEKANKRDCLHPFTLYLIKLKSCEILFLCFQIIRWPVIFRRIIRR